MPVVTPPTPFYALSNVSKRTRMNSQVTALLVRALARVVPGTRLLTSNVFWACGLSPLFAVRSLRPRLSDGFRVFSVEQSTSLGSITT